MSLPKRLREEGISQHGYYAGFDPANPMKFVLARVSLWEKVKFYVCNWLGR